MYLSTTLMFSGKLMRTFQWHTAGLTGKAEGLSGFNSKQSISLGSSSSSGGCRAACRKPCFKAPRRLLRLKEVPGPVGISLRNCKCVTLRKRCTFMKSEKPSSKLAGYWSQRSLTGASSCAVNPRHSQAPGWRISPSFALFPINGVNSSADVPQLCEEDNTQREKSVQYCFIFMPLSDRKISIHCDTLVVLVGINARLWENADTSCQKKLFTMSLPSFFRHFHYTLFSFTERWAKLVHWL